MKRILLIVPIALVAGCVSYSDRPEHNKVFFRGEEIPPKSLSELTAAIALGTELYKHDHVNGRGVSGVSTWGHWQDEEEEIVSDHFDVEK